MPMPPELAEEGAAARVLVLVDHKGQAEQLIAVARRAGFEVETTQSGFAAGLAIGRFKPDILLFDLATVGDDAFKAIAELRANEGTTTLPAIAIAGARDDRAKRKSQSAGFNDFMQKPLDADDLQRRVDEALRALRTA